MTFTITQLNEADKIDWITLRNASDPWPSENNREDIFEANWKKIINAENPLVGLGLYKGDKLIGYGLFFFSPCIRTSSDECMVRDLFVAEEYRRQGGGTALMHAIHDKAEKLGAGRIFWVANPEREGVLEFYTSFGVECCDEKVFIKWLEAA